MKKFMNNLIILGFERVFLEANIDKDKEDTNDRSKQLS